MEFNSQKLRNAILNNNERDVMKIIKSGLDPNVEGGWPVRLAARFGCYNIVKILVQNGADPNLLGESGASTLQLAVYSGQHWDSDKWSFLLSYCDSSQLADGAAVAIIFNNVAALKMILETGRCNLNIPTTLTGKTLETLAKGYKLHHMLNIPPLAVIRNITPTTSPRISEQNRLETQDALTPRQTQRNLSPSVARFFHQTANQTSLTSRRIAFMSSPTRRMMT